MRPRRGTKTIKLVLSEVSAGKGVEANFSIKDSGSALGITSVTVSGTEVEIVMDDVIQNNADITINYTASDSAKINDSAGNVLETTSSPVAVSLTQDTDAPTIKSAKADAGTKLIVLDLSEEVTGAPDAGDFAVSIDGSAATVSSVALASDGLSVTLTLSDFITNGQSLLLNYTQNSSSSKQLNDTLSTPLASISGVSVSLTDDAVIPTITSVTSTTSDGTYKSGQQVSIDVKFSEDVLITGTPQLQLETGTTDQKADFASVSGSTATFTYTILTGDVSSDLDYTSASALTLNSGTIVDVSNNAANLALVDPGQPGSLGNASAIVIDTAAPDVTVSDISYSSANNDLKISGTGLGDVASFDWTKFKLDINSDDDTTTDHVFSDADIDQILSSSDTRITVLLVDDSVSTTGANKIEAMTGFGVAGGKDSFEISSGFFIDTPGNVSTSTADVRWKIPTVTSANYTETTNTLTLKGQDLDLISDYNISQVNWDKFTWNVDGSSAAS